MATRKQLTDSFILWRRRFPSPACDASVGLRPWARISKRDYAMADAENNQVWFNDKALAELSLEQLDGLVLHELGHLADPDIDRPGRERRADRLAQEHTGVEIRYDEWNIQTIGEGKTPRPGHLHR